MNKMRTGRCSKLDTLLVCRIRERENGKETGKVMRLGRYGICRLGTTLWRTSTTDFR